MIQCLIQGDDLVEENNYLVGGSIGPYNENPDWDDDDIDPSGIGGESSEEDTKLFSEYIKGVKEAKNKK